MQLYIHRDGQQFGPYTAGDTQKHLQDGTLVPTDLAWYEGASDWIPLSAIPDISAIATPPSPPQRIMPPLAPVSAAGPTATIEWHYSTDGHRLGPVAEDQINELVKLKKITDQSLVWNKTMPDWQPFLDSKFANLVRDPNAPPPLTGAAVNNTIIWVLAFAPLIGVFLQGFFSGLTGIPLESLWFITLLLNIILGYADEKKLKSAGHDTSKMGAAWLVPVYLFKRAKILKHNNTYFIVWCVLFGLSLFV